MNGTRWTKEEVFRLKTLFNESVPDDEIADILQRSKNSIKVKRYKSEIIGDPRARRISEKSRQGMRRRPTGPDSPMWKGGRRINSQGHIELFIPDHPRARKNGYVFEHIVIIEKILRRSLREDECVHHVNGKKDDNSPGNLQVIKKYRHSGFHGKRNKRGIDLICPVYGKEFYVKQSHVNKRITCGRECVKVLFREYSRGYPRGHRYSIDEKIRIQQEVSSVC